MKNPSKDAEESLEKMIRRSYELHAAIANNLRGTDFDDSVNREACFGMCSVSLEHALSIRILIERGCPTSAIALNRLQFEAVTRAMWLIYAADDEAIAKVIAPLTKESEKAATNLPSVSKMISQIGLQVGITAPAAAHQMLVNYKDVLLPALNSFVHGGIHPLRRHMEGYPMPIILSILQNSNGLSTMAGMTMALITGNESVMKAVGSMQRQFEDCLPELLA